jgi:hypothetical protein
MNIIRLSLQMMPALAATLMISQTVSAQTLPVPLAASGNVIRLTPAEIEAELTKAAARNAPSAWLDTAELAPPLADHLPHGEFGFFVGSGGTRGVFGSTVVPLGDHASAEFSFSTGRSPGYRSRY